MTYLLNINKLELLVFLAKNCVQNFVERGKVQVFCLVEVLSSQTGIPKGLEKKFWWEWNDLGILRAWEGAF